MKKILAILLTLVLVVSFTACSKNNDKDNNVDNNNSTNVSDNKDVPETKVVRWNYGTSGNVLVTIAQEKGYFKEYGIELEMISATANADAMALLSTNQVDIVSNSGTSNPLQLLASGVDITIFGPV